MTVDQGMQRAARVAPLVSGDRLKLARELRGLTQRELVERTHGALTAPALSQLEKGRSRPSPRTLVALANATECPPEFFLTRHGDVMPEGFFRSLRAASARERRQHLARARVLHDFIEALEEYVSFPELDLPATRVGDTPHDVERAATQLRRRWGLEAGPIPNVVRVLERNGIVVVRVDAFKREVDAFSVSFEGRPIVVLGSEKGVTARSRFDAAHELGHLVLHDETYAGHTETEREAHEFAAAFLMPADDIRDHLPQRADWAQLMRLKTHWRVSIQALLRRAFTLQVMSKQRYVSAMKAMSAKGWRTNEPGDEKLGTLEAPQLLRRAIDHLAEAGSTWQDVAVQAALPVDSVRELIERTKDPRPRVEL